MLVSSQCLFFGFFFSLLTCISRQSCLGAACAPSWGGCPCGAGCGTAITHAALENLLKQGDRAHRTPPRKILCIRLMFARSYPTTPQKRGQSVCLYSSILNQIFFVPFCVRDHSATKVLHFSFEKSNMVIILKVEASLLITFWHFSVSKAETQLFQKIN